MEAGVGALRASALGGGGSLRVCLSSSVMINRPDSDLQVFSLIFALTVEGFPQLGWRRSEP